jgi:hypothetical protein
MTQGKQAFGRFEGVVEELWVHAMVDDIDEAYLLTCAHD